MKQQSVGYRNLHPSSTGRNGRRLGLTTRYGCKQCGFRVNALERSGKSTEDQFDGVVIGGEEDDRTISAPEGCPHCGSFNWSDKVRTPLTQRPEDPKAAVSGIKRHYPKRYERF